MTNRFDITRRDVLRGLGGLAITAVACNSEDGAAIDSPSTSSVASAETGVSTIPAAANRAMLPSTVQRLPVQAYAQNSVAAGDTIQFRVSSAASYTLSVMRLGWDPGASQDTTLYTFPTAGPAEQLVRPGSYIHVERALPSTTALSKLTLECWVRPFRIGWQGLITQYTYGGACGFGLFITDDGRPACYFGSGGAFDAVNLHYGATPLPVQAWSHLVARFDRGGVHLYVNGVLSTSALGTLNTVTPGPSPLRLGAYGDDSGTIGFLDGDLAMPVIYSRALAPNEIQTRATTLPPTVAPGPLAAIEGCWALSEEAGVDVVDSSTSARAGVIVNRGTWMIGGPGFDASAVDRFGSYDPASDFTRGHSLRLSSADLHDCAWQVTQSYTVPSDVSPGIYVGRIPYVFADPCSGQPVNRVYDVPFVVRRHPTRLPAPIVVLCATNTWHAYNVPLLARKLAPSMGDACDKPEFGFGYGFYKNHPSGQPTYLTGINMPWSAPGERADLVPAERCLHVWLEQNGYNFDVISDYDLNSNPAILDQYRVMFIAGHSEYWSREMYQGVIDYLASGHRVICASGNTMFWRVSFDADVIECRKYPAAVNSLSNVEIGEVYHQHDGQRGGLMREAGYPAWQAIGLDCAGFDAKWLPYSVSSPTHEFFTSPESAGVVNGSPLGGAFAIYGEWDTMLQLIPGAPDRPASYTPTLLAQGQRWAARKDYHGEAIGDGESYGVISAMIDWQRTDGGRVFSVGSIGASSALLTDRGLAVTFRNALHQMGVVFRLNVSAINADGRFMNTSFNGTSWDPGWLASGASFRDPPTGVMFAAANLATMAISTAGRFYYRYFDGTNWGSWFDFGGNFKGRPAAVAWGSDKLTLFACGNDGHLYEKAWDGAAWSAWQDLGGGVASDVSAVAWEGSKLSVAVRGSGGSILYKYNVGGSWYPSQTTWDDMGGSFDQAPTMLAWNGNNLSIFAVNAGHVYAKKWNGSAWLPLAGWEDIGLGAVASRLAVATWGPAQYTLFGRGTDNRIKSKWWDGVAWAPSQTGWSDDLGGAFVGEPAAASFRGGSIELMAVTTGGDLQHRVWDGMTWSAWTSLGGSLLGSPAIFRWV